MNNKSREARKGKHTLLNLDWLINWIKIVDNELNNFIHKLQERYLKIEKKFEAERVSVLLSALTSMIVLTLLNVVSVCESLLSIEVVNRTENLANQRSIQSSEELEKQ